MDSEDLNALFCESELVAVVKSMVIATRANWTTNKPIPDSIIIKMTAVRHLYHN